MSTPEILDEAARLMHRAANRLAKWRQVLAGWQLGSRVDGDPECAAVRDHREITMMLRAESNAIVALLIKKGIFTELEWTQALTAELEQYERDMQKRFPGMLATDDGIQYDVAVANATMQRLNFKP